MSDQLVTTIGAAAELQCIRAGDLLDLLDPLDRNAWVWVRVGGHNYGVNRVHRKDGQVILIADDDNAVAA